ncbi:hypothetical protein ACOCG7_23750 [Paraburkholderia sp. DD10]|uniref:hypothetical protein n=1 Tax=Paraburkholderia sp. DD10 TaxID=3409691 RepID=UPI003BA133B8
MKRLPQLTIAALLTVPMYVGLTRIDALVAWIQTDMAWKALLPIFRLFGVIGAEGEENVIVALLLLFSFVLAFCIVCIAAHMLKRRKPRKLESH